MESEAKRRYQHRFYREYAPRHGLVAFSVALGETDLYILAKSQLSALAMSVLKGSRRALEDYILERPEFSTALEPVEPSIEAPAIVNWLCTTSEKVGVGPMAGVAGAIAQTVGERLLQETKEVLVENGGDIFVQCRRERTVGLYAGESSPFSFRIGLKVRPETTPLGICTSSGTVGHSLSFGRADASVVISKDTALADAAATALGNRVQNEQDIEQALEWSRTVDGVLGAVVVVGEKIGAWGLLELVRM